MSPQIEVSASAVKALRDRTGAGMMDCRNALLENKGDMETSIEYLRKKGLAAASKKSGRVAAEGVIAVNVSADGKKASVIEVNSETDFVAKNSQFQELARKIANVAGEYNNDVESLKQARPSGFSQTVQEIVVEHIAIIGENLNLRRIATISVTEGVVAHYVHNMVADQMGKIGVLVALESKAPVEQLKQLGKQLAMHIAATSPEALRIEDLDPKRIEKEKNILREQSLASGKPPEVIEKMLEGRVRKFFEEVVLLEQVFVMDGKTKVSVIIEEATKVAGTPIKIAGYVRFALGEGIEKEQTDFAEEVASMVK